MKFTVALALSLEGKFTGMSFMLRVQIKRRLKIWNKISGPQVRHVHKDLQYAQLSISQNCPDIHFAIWD